jgi:uncharacterized ferritin-like protein (DUF455 family)
VTTLSRHAVDILDTADPSAKVFKTAAVVAAWRRGELDVGDCTPPARPARPAKPALLSPQEMPRRSAGPKGRVALVHAIAHIELNAIDLAWDIIARFTSRDLPRAYYDDWVDVAQEEAEHFAALAARLHALDAAYGDLPAHDGLWEAAARTSDDLAARLVLIPMTMEARGLDTTPATCARLRQADDDETAQVLDMIFTDEIKHLAVGVRWFEFLCARDGKNPHHAYPEILEARYPGKLQGNFNLEASAQAGMGRAYLAPWLDGHSTAV